jgi:hypothetical protein
VVWGERYDRWGATEEGLTVETSSESIFQQYCAPDLQALKDQGAIGVIAAWNGVSDANAKDQYIPFGRLRPDIPGLWVGESAGAEIKAAIARQAEVTMVLEADVFPDATTDNIVATLPGDTGETVLLFTHTDGNNATEENGGLALIAIANHLASLPRRQRTYSFIFDTGHMAYSQVPVLVNFARTVVGLAIEHLGAREWAEDESGNYLPTGRNSISWMLTDRKYLAELTLACSRGLVERTLAVDPVKKQFNGEGSALYRTGKPTMGYLPIPEWLLTSPPSGEIEKMDADLLYAQTVAMARIARHLDTFDLNLISS